MDAVYARYIVLVQKDIILHVGSNTKRVTK